MISNCRQSLFFSKIRREERQTSMRESVTVIVTCKRQCSEPLVAWASSPPTPVQLAAYGMQGRYGDSHAPTLVLRFSHSFLRKETMLVV